MRRWIFFVSLLMSFAAIGPVAAQEFGLQTVREGEPQISADGTQTFRLFSGECSGKRYESKRLNVTTADCDRKRTRVEYFEPKANRAREGDRKLYSWEIFVPEDFAYTATGGHLIAGQFHNGDDLLLSFALGADGYTIRSKPCIRPEDFGEWHKVEVKYQFDSTKKKNFKDRTAGVLVVTCDGNEVVNASGRPNIAQGNVVYFKYGLYGALDIPETDNVTVKFRNVQVSHW